MIAVLTFLVGGLLGLCGGWYSKQVLNTLNSIRYQLIRLLKKPTIDLDPLAGVRVQQIIPPKPPDQFDNPNDPYSS